MSQRQKPASSSLQGGLLEVVHHDSLRSNLILFVDTEVGPSVLL